MSAKNGTKNDKTPVPAAAAASPPSTEIAKQEPAAQPAARPRARRPMKPARGLELMKLNPAVLDDAISEKLDALSALAEDPTLPAEYQTLVRNLVSQASSDKPGMEEVQQGWRIPLIHLNQPTTTAAARPEAAKLGDLYSSAGKIIERPFAFLPFAIYQENVMFPEGAKVPTCAAPDAQLGSPYGKCVDCPHLPFGMQLTEDQKKTDCQNQFVAVVATLDLTQIYMIRFAKTSRKAGGALQALAGASHRMWTNGYHLTSEKGSGQQGAYFTFKIEPTGKPNNEHVCRVAQALCDLYRAERDRLLAEHYRAAASAPAMAAAAETAFSGSKLDAGLAGESESFDLGEAPPATSSVRSAAKPM